jgi:AraC-like DNA-binding protein
VATFGAKAVSYPSVTHYLREVIFASSNPPNPLPMPEHQLDDSGQAILLQLADQSFASIPELSRLAHLPRTTVHRRLMQYLGFCVRHLRWVLHFLSRCQKLDRVRLSQQCFLMLERQERRSWHDNVTLDESWFCLHTDCELIWAQPDAEIPERERHTVQSQKVMRTIVWNPGGFHLVNILPKGFEFNAS